MAATKPNHNIMVTTYAYNISAGQEFLLPSAAHYLYAKCPDM